MKQYKKMVGTLPFFVTMIFLTMYSTSVNGQGRRDQIRDRIRANHAAFITKELDLTETEAQKFWPVYNAYRDEMEALRDTDIFGKIESLTDKEADDALNVFLENKAKEADIQKKYIQKLKTAIPSRKIIMLWKAEREYRERVVSTIRKRADLKNR